MTKEAFFETINDLLRDPIYLAENLEELGKEIEVNHWSIGIDAATAKQINCDDLNSFLRKVIANRMEQLEESTKDLDLLFYLWFDAQAGNLNFNFINAAHHKLPFAADLEFVDSPKSILKDFLTSAEEFEEDRGDIQVKYVLEVYKKQLTISKNKKP